jgi:hypothetical protein
MEDLPPHARALRELHRMNHTMMDVEQAIAEAGTLADGDVQGLWIIAEATRGRLTALLDQFAASNPEAARMAERVVTQAHS